MIQIKPENEIAKKINAIFSSQIYYDYSRFTLFIYADGATKEQVQKIKEITLNYIDLTNMQATYRNITVYS